MQQKRKVNKISIARKENNAMYNKVEKATYISTEEVYGRVPLDTSPATVCVTNHIIEMTVMEKQRHRKCSVRKINKDYYMVERTGEIKKYGEKSNKKKKVNMNNKFTALRRIINLNFIGLDSEIHVTLTYSKAMYDREQVSKDFKKFWKHLKFSYPDLEYVAIYEPSRLGSWHIHVLIKSIKKRGLYISQYELKYLWGNGYVYVNKIKNNDNIGAYFVALLSIDKTYGGDKKKVARLHYYTKGYRLYSCSTGIEKPTCLKMSYKDAMKMIGDIPPCFEKNYGIFRTEDDSEINVIYHMQYNRKRTVEILDKQDPFYRLKLLHLKNGRR